MPTAPAQQQPAKTIQASAGEIFLRRLAANGIDYLFANGGTDFAPVIEGYAHAQVADFKVPTPIITPHETAALGMAHGYYLATGRAQAVMVHTNVGLANCVMGVLNAASDHVPIILASGISRTPSLACSDTAIRPSIGARICVTRLRSSASRSNGM